jgi:Uncharacterized protein conserved in bacteria (DUF2179).
VPISSAPSSAAAPCTTSAAAIPAAPHTEIQCLLTQDEFARVMNFVKKKDIQAFITAGNVSEIYGMWNKSKHKKVEK